MTRENSKPETPTPEKQDIPATAATTDIDAANPDAASVQSTSLQAEQAGSKTTSQAVSEAEAAANGTEKVSFEETIGQEEPLSQNPATVSPGKAETVGLIKQSTTWSTILGALMMVLGIAAISLPLVTSLALTLWIGWLLVGNSIIKLIYAIQTRRQGSFWLKLVLAGLYLAAGVVLAVNPLEAVLTLTLLLGSFLVAEGVVELLLAIQMRSRSNWLWLLFNALLTLALGIFIWAEWPLDAPWVIGLLVGISFIASGLSRIMLSIAVRSTIRQLADAV